MRGGGIYFKVRKARRNYEKPEYHLAKRSPNVM